MPVTPIYSFPYPALTDPPNGAAQIQALAEAVETEIDSLDASQSATVATLANPARAQMRASVATSVPNSTFTAIAFDLEDYDSAAGHSTSVNNSRYTSQVAGKYYITGGVGFSATVTGNKFLEWRVNGVAVGAGLNSYPAQTTNTSSFEARPMYVELAVGDYVQLFVQQLSGVTVSTSAGNSYMAVLLVRNNAL